MGLSFIIIVYLFIFCNFYILSTSDNHISNTSIVNLKVDNHHNITLISLLILIADIIIIQIVSK